MSGKTGPLPASGLSIQGRNKGKGGKSKGKGAASSGPSSPQKENTVKLGGEQQGGSYQVSVDGRFLDRLHCGWVRTQQ